MPKPRPMPVPLKGQHLQSYLEQHGSRAAPSDTSNRQLPGHALGGLRTIDSLARAKLEREAASTAMLAVLTFWVPLFPVFTLVAGASRWAESSRAYGGHAGRTAVVISVASLAFQFIFILVVK